MPHILITADIHLQANEQHPINQKFYSFLNTLAPKAKAVYLIGDVFEMWLGDDIGIAENQTVIKLFKKITDNGTPIYLMYGNRDFLMGKQFWQATGIIPLSDPFLLNYANNHFILSHGDHLCTDDTDYQKMRKWFRNPVIQWVFLKLSKKKRLAIGNKMRLKSKTLSQNKAENIMDVNDKAVASIFAEYPVSNTLIHGHTHRPKCHQTTIKQLVKTRWVLGDWRPDADYLKIDETGQIECLNTSKSF